MAFNDTASLPIAIVLAASVALVDALEPIKVFPAPVARVVAPVAPVVVPYSSNLT